MASQFFPAPAALLVLAATALMPAPAEAHWHRTGVYVGFGPAYYGGYYAPYPVYAVVPAPMYMPPPVVVSSPPPLAQAPATDARYFCNDPKGYYPEVPACPSGWAELPAVPADFRKAVPSARK